MNIRKAVFFAVALASAAFAVSCAEAKDEAETTAASIDLASLSLSAGTLSPAFNKDVTEYTASVANGVTEVTVTATTVDKYAGLGKSPANPVKLDVGKNDIVITVTASDYDFAKPDPAKVKRTYVYVTRAAQ